MQHRNARILRGVLIASMSLATAVGLSACEDDGLEEVGESIDEGIEEVGDEIDDATN